MRLFISPIVTIVVACRLFVFCLFVCSLVLVSWFSFFVVCFFVHVCVGTCCTCCFVLCACFVCVCYSPPFLFGLSVLLCLFGLSLLVLWCVVCPFFL